MDSTKEAPTTSKKVTGASTTSTTKVIEKQAIRFKKSDSIKYLETLALEAKRTRFPSIPVAYLTINGYKDNSANGLTKCIISFIRLMGGQAERISTTGRAIDRQTTFTDVTGRTRTIGRIEWIPGTGTNGSADISATIKGRSVKIEVKMKDSQSRDQVNYQKSIEQAGGVYIIARSFDGFLSWYNQNYK